MRSRLSYGGGDRDAVIGRITTADPGDVDTDGLPNDWENAVWARPERSERRQRRERRSRRRSSSTTRRRLASGSHPRGFVITYLAEGATGTFFDTRLAIANPTGTPAKVLTRFQKPSGTVVPLFSNVGAHTRATIDVDTVAGMESEAFSTLIEADVQVVADRTMTWDSHRLRQPRRTRHPDAHGDDLVSGGGRDARLLRSVLPDSESGQQSVEHRDHLPAAGSAAADRADVDGGGKQPRHDPGRRAAGPRGDRRVREHPLDQRRAVRGGARDVFQPPGTALRGRSRKRGRHGARHALVPRRGRDRIVLQHLHPDRQSERG